jgi:hypothetical protein
MWICPKCAAHVNQQLDVCRRCGTPPRKPDPDRDAVVEPPPYTPEDARLTLEPKALAKVAAVELESSSFNTWGWRIGSRAGFVVGTILVVLLVLDNVFSTGSTHGVGGPMGVFFFLCMAPVVGFLVSLVFGGFGAFIGEVFNPTDECPPKVAEALSEFPQQPDYWRPGEAALDGAGQDGPDETTQIQPQDVLEAERGIRSKETE